MDSNRGSIPPALPGVPCCDTTKVYQNLKNKITILGLRRLHFHGTPTGSYLSGFRPGIGPPTRLALASGRRFCLHKRKADGLWRAVDTEGEVLDILVQPRRNKKAALKPMRKLLKKQGYVVNEVVTTSRSDNENKGPGASSHLFRRNGFSPPTPPSTTPSTFNVI